MKSENHSLATWSLPFPKLQGGEEMCGNDPSFNYTVNNVNNSCYVLSPHCKLEHSDVASSSSQYNHGRGGSY